MTPLADPHRCPSCRSDLPPHLVCGTCGLDLRGDLGMRLFAVLTQADGLIAQMRSQVRQPVAAATDAAPTAPSTAPPSTQPALGTLPAYPAPPPRASEKVGLGAVPTVLLGLGALCVLVAASLFLPFAWSLLGVVGRTVVLILLTAAAGAVARAAGDRGLRATSESLGGVMLGLLTFDVLGARSSGWFGDISDPAFTVLLGAVLVAAGTAATMWLRRTEVASFVAGEVAAVLGSLLLLVGGSTLDVGDESQRLAAMVPVLAVLALGSARLRTSRPGLDSMATATVGHATIVALAWLGLVLTGLAEIVGGTSYAEMWPGGAGLTLLLAGAYAAAPALVGAVAPSLRAACLAVALLPWVVAATAPAYDETADTRTLAVLAPLLLCLALVPVLPRPWSWIGIPTGLVAALAATALVAPLTITAVATFVETVEPVWGGRVDGRALASWDAEALGSAWLLPVVVLALATTVVVTAREANDDPTLSIRPLALLGAWLTLLAVTGALLLAGAPVWTVLALLLTATVVASMAAWRSGEADLHVVQLVTGAVALVLSWHDEWLTLAACLVLLGLAVAHHVHGPATARAAAGLGVAALLGGSLWTAGALLEAQAAWTALVVLLVSAALVISRGLLDDRTGVAGVEVGAALTGFVALVAGVEGAPAPHEQAWLAVYLTVAGAAATVVALTRTDRREVGWVGGLLLAAATWVRLAEIGVEAPEPYTLPSALALLVAGWHRTRRTPAVGTLRAWGPGLCLALVPSLLWAMDEPLSWRAVLLGLACLALVLAGAQLRLAAPFVWGASVGAVLVLWEVVPPAFEMSAWLVMGVVGAVLLVVGASWEQRVRDARGALGYVRGLR